MYGESVLAPSGEASGGPNAHKTQHIYRYTRYTTDRAWFSCLLWHPARKWSGSILTSWSPHV